MSALPDASGPEQQNAFPCASCGARLAFAPGTRALRCPYCGAENAIAESRNEIRELDLDDYLERVLKEAPVTETNLAKCTSCGAESSLPANVAADACPFCSAPLLSKAFSKRLIQPAAVVPFQVDKNQAMERFRAWLRGLWLAPGELKKYAQTEGGLKGVYLPHWTYDCATQTLYTGERGTDYTTSEWVEINGQRQQRQVTRTEWSPASGSVGVTFDDVLVNASKTLPPDKVTALQPWSLAKLTPFRNEFLAGFRAEAYQIDLKGGLAIAKQIMDARIRRACEQDIGGDHQRVHSMNTRYSDITFKHVLLPVWIAAYRYRDKAYQFIINGETGKVFGESPKSFWKVAALVAVGIIVVLVFFSLGKR